jgi:hypothetical protein
MHDAVDSTRRGRYRGDVAYVGHDRFFAGSNVGAGPDIEQPQAVVARQPGTQNGADLARSAGNEHAGHGRYQ